jgi:hypothetical protein
MCFSLSVLMVAFDDVTWNAIKNREKLPTLHLYSFDLNLKSIVF